MLNGYGITNAISLFTVFPLATLLPQKKESKDKSRDFLCRQIPCTQNSLPAHITAAGYIS